ncbi:MAG: chorismate-binding protein [Bdellovibrionia bacterium]
MKRQINISTAEFTNFLLDGSILRKDGRILLFKPLEAGQDVGNKPTVSIACYEFFDFKEGLAFKAVEWQNFTPEEFETVLLQYLSQSGVQQSEIEIQWQPTNKSGFIDSFRDIKAQMEKGDLKKAVPVVFESARKHLSPHLLAQILLNSLRAPESLYFYGIWRKGVGAFGTTPEVLFHLRGSVLETMALAGTMPKTQSENRVSLLEDLKEVDEHSFVVEDIESILRQWGTVGVQGPQIIELPHLFHLQTLLQVNLKNKVDKLELLKHLHPTAALGVFPRNQLGFLRTSPEQNNRGLFGGPAVFEFAQETLALVMIRSIFWDQHDIRIGSGCGIVPASELEREWFELEQKRASVKRIMGLSL